MPNVFSFFLVGLGFGLVWVFVPGVRLWYRRWRYRRSQRAIASPDTPPQRLTVDQEAAAIRDAELKDRSARATAFVERYCADMIRDGVPASEAYREGRRVWDDINLMG